MARQLGEFEAVDMDLLRALFGVGTRVVPRCRAGQPWVARIAANPMPHNDQGHGLVVSVTDRSLTEFSS